MRMQGPDKATLLSPQDWALPVPIAYGPGRLAEIGPRCAAMGVRRPLIVTDRGSAGLPFVARLGEFLSDAGLSPALFAGISPNPVGEEIGSGSETLRSGGHDAVIAIGGGSAMDAGKAICLASGAGIDLWDFDFDRQPPVLPPGFAFPRLVTIPTTAGTGAETESTAMVTHAGKGMKFCLWHPQLKPSLALLDPELTVGLPPNLTAWTGADALTHAIEAFLVPGYQPLCDAAALEALGLVARWLPVAVREPGNLTARGGMLMGSCLAGIAFLKGLGLVHAVSHMVGAEFDTHHGLTNAILLPAVLRFNLPGLEEKTARMAEAMSLPDRSVEGFIVHVETLLDEIGVPRTLAEIGVPADCAARIAGKAMQDAAARTNPRAASEAEVRGLIEAAIARGR